MSTAEQMRHALHRKLARVLGDDEAATLMGYLPPAGWADVAAKRDVDVLEREIADLRASADRRFDRVDERFDRVDARLDRVDERFDRVDARLDALRAELVAQSRTFVLTSAASILTTASLAFAAARFAGG